MPIRLEKSDKAYVSPLCQFSVKFGTIGQPSDALGIESRLDLASGALYIFIFCILGYVDSLEQYLKFWRAQIESSSRYGRANHKICLLIHAPSRQSPSLTKIWQIA